MLLLLTMVVLLVLSSLAGASLINSLLERSQVSSQANAVIALNAAEGGGAAGMAWLSDPANSDNYPSTTTDVPDPSTIADAYTTNTGWQTWSNTLLRTFSNGGSYQVTLRFKRERRDRNGDGDCCDKYPEVVFDESSEFKDGDTNACTDCPGELVLYNEGTGDDHFGFSDSNYSGNRGDEGFPLMEIDAVGTYGSSAVREIAQFVARNKPKLNSNAAITSAGNIKLSGNLQVDGRQHNLDGSDGGICENSQPGVSYPGPRDLNGDGDTTDPGETSSLDQGSSSAPVGTPVGSDDNALLSNSPDEAMGLCGIDNELDCEKIDETTVFGGPIANMINGLPAEGSSKTFEKMVYVNIDGDYDISAVAAGILIVHNPLFNPKKWLCSIPVVPDPAAPTNANSQIPNPYLTAPPASVSNECFGWNTATNTHDRPNYDATLNANYQNNKFAHEQSSAYVKERRPRNLTGNGNSTFTGLIVADQINPINGNLTIIGAVITLSRTSIAILGNGNAKILYSCDALNFYTAQRYKKKIGWQRLR